VDECLLPLTAWGMTELQYGLDCAHQFLPDESGCQHIILLTDGEPTNTPSGGYPAYVAKLFRENKHVTLHTVGFGNNIGVDLLRDMAAVTGGQFAYISDVQMLGTVFNHLVSNLMATVATRIQVDGVEVGSLLDGQTRDILLSNPDPNIAITYQTGSKACKSYINHWMIDQAGVTEASARQAWTDIQDPASLKAVQARIQNLPQTELLEMMQHDLHGEVKLAMLNMSKWGKPYLTAITDAHQKQMCTNFKDISLQGYLTDAVRAHVKRGEQVFATIPSTMLTAKLAIAQAQPLNGLFMDSNATCLDGSCQVLMADGTLIPVEKLEKGMKVRNMQGTESTVRCKVRSFCTQRMYVTPENLILTAHHPVYYNDDWVHPYSVPAFVNTTTSRFVYSFLMEKHTVENPLQHTMIVQGVTVMCLASQIRAPLIWDNFWSTENVTLSLMKSSQFASGCVDVLGVLRDKDHHAVDLVTM
jgi:hypothetical protein